MSLLASELDSKRQALLGEALPEGVPVAALGDLARGAEMREPLQAAVAIRNQRLILVQGNTAQQLTSALAEAQAGGARGVNVLASSILFGHARLIVNRASALGLASMFQWPDLARHDGALMAYGPPFQSIIRQLAAIIARLMAGARPPGLPVQQPTEIELVINLKTARALGLSIPVSLLARASDVVE